MGQSGGVDLTGETFQGFRREDGRVGVRNLVAVVPVSVTASPLAVAVADDGPARARATPHQLPLAPTAETRSRVETVLTGVGRNPNVAGTLFVALGTEAVDPDGLADAVADCGTPVRVVTIHGAGGTAAAREAAADHLADLCEEARSVGRSAASVGELTVALECGGSDATSGFAANPVVGEVADAVVDAGGTACLSETPEFIGAEHVLADRCVDDAVRERLLDCVDRRERLADEMGVDFRGAQPSPGNQAGGLTTLEEKSLGAVAKAGSAPLSAVVRYGEPLPDGAGLVVMDSPGFDVESVTGKVAGGAQLVLFTTGRGSTTGNPIAPVCKVTANARTADRLAGNVDVDASGVLDGESIERVGGRLAEAMLDVASGRRTAAETHRMREFAITEVPPDRGRAPGGQA